MRRNRSSRPDPPLEFQSTHPVRGATLCTTATRQGCTRFQSTHPVRGATAASLTEQIEAAISIHAPRAGCDRQPPQKRALCPNFNPRTPCGVRPCGLRGLTTRLLFQSTHPVRGATFETVYDFAYTEFQSTHPVRGATAARRLSRSNRRYFNPRTPCGVRQNNPRSRQKARQFQSTHPVRGATLTAGNLSKQSLFQSTHPVRGATCWRLLRQKRRDISIHAPRAGCDGKFDGFTRPNLRKRYKKVSVQPKKRAKKKIKEMLCSHSHIFGWISGAKVPEFPAR